MKKILLWIIIGVVLVAIVFGVKGFIKKKALNNDSAIDSSAEQAGANQKTVNSEAAGSKNSSSGVITLDQLSTFSGGRKCALGEPFNMVMYATRGQARIDIAGPNGQAVHYIINSLSNQMIMWSTGSPEGNQGVKASMTDASTRKGFEDPFLEMQRNGLCGDWAVDSTFFASPKNVEFLTLPGVQ